MIKAGTQTVFKGRSMLPIHQINSWPVPSGYRDEQLGQPWRGHSWGYHYSAEKRYFKGNIIIWRPWKGSMETKNKMGMVLKKKRILWQSNWFCYNAWEKCPFCPSPVLLKYNWSAPSKNSTFLYIKVSSRHMATVWAKLRMQLCPKTTVIWKWVHSLGIQWDKNYRSICGYLAHVVEFYGCKFKQCCTFEEF